MTPDNPNVLPYGEHKIVQGKCSACGCGVEAIRRFGWKCKDAPDRETFKQAAGEPARAVAPIHPTSFLDFILICTFVGCTIGFYLCLRERLNYTEGAYATLTESQFIKRSPEFAGSNRRDSFYANDYRFYHEGRAYQAQTFTDTKQTEPVRVYFNSTDPRDNSVGERKPLWWCLFGLFGSLSLLTLDIVGTGSRRRGLLLLASWIRRRGDAV